jgi:hypothetical protein
VSFTEQITKVNAIRYVHNYHSSFKHYDGKKSTEVFQRDMLHKVHVSETTHLVIR